MGTAVQIVGLTLMVVGIVIFGVSLAGMLGFLPPPRWGRAPAALTATAPETPAFPWPPGRTGQLGVLWSVRTGDRRSWPYGLVDGDAYTLAHDRLLDIADWMVKACIGAILGFAGARAGARHSDPPAS